MERCVFPSSQAKPAEAAKVGPGDLKDALKWLPEQEASELIVGFETSDDAPFSVWKTAKPFCKQSISFRRSSIRRVFSGRSPRRTPSRISTRWAAGL